MPALPLEVRVVHRTFRDPFVGPEDAALVQHGVDQGGLAVVDVRNDGNVPAERIGNDRTGFSGAKTSSQYTGWNRSTVRDSSRRPQPVRINPSGAFDVLCLWRSRPLPAGR